MMSPDNNQGWEIIIPGTLPLLSLFIMKLFGGGDFSRVSLGLEIVVLDTPPVSA